MACQYLRIVLAATLGLSGLVVAHPASADTGDKKQPGPFSFEFSVGALYDSNVGLAELDTSSGEGDVAATMNVAVGVADRLTKRLSYKFGYDFSQSRHKEFETFDVRIHRGSTELAYDFGRIDVGVNFQYADAAVDGDEFLVLKRTSPFLSRLFGKKFFLRLAHDRTDKSFATNLGRNATANAWSADSFVFVDGVKLYFVFGLQYLTEDALDNQFDYDGGKFKLQLARRFNRGEREYRLKTGLRHGFRNYSPAGFLPAEVREDDTYGFEAELEITLRKRGFSRIRYQYNDSRSTLASVDFDEHVVGIEFGARF